MRTLVKFNCKYHVIYSIRFLSVLTMKKPEIGRRIRIYASIFPAKVEKETAHLFLRPKESGQLSHSLVQR